MAVWSSDGSRDRLSPKDGTTDNQAEAWVDETESRCAKLSAGEALSYSSLN